MAALLQQKASLGNAKIAQTTRRVNRAAVLCHAQKTEDLSRRTALGTLAGVATLLTGTAPSLAAYGDSANVFGKITNKSGVIPYAGDGFALLLPSKWNPSKEQDVGRDGRSVLLRYEDNGDSVNNVTVVTEPTSQTSIEGLGDETKVLQKISYLFGNQVFTGETISEGGFKPNRVSAVSLLDQSSTTDKKGKKFYKYQLLTRSADGNEGGRHQLITAGVSNGQLWVLRVQIGDKRWFKGADRDAKSIQESFTVA